METSSNFESELLNPNFILKENDTMVSVDTNSADLEGIYVGSIVEIFTKLLNSKSRALGTLKLIIAETERQKLCKVMFRITVTE